MAVLATCSKSPLRRNPGCVAASIPTVAHHLREKGYRFLASVHGVDYFPEEPRLGVHYELIDMSKVDRIGVREFVFELRGADGRA